MSIPKYEELTEFQKWAIFYVIKYNKMPADLEGVMKGMCSTLKIKIDLEKYDEEIEKLRVEAKQLSKYKIFNLMYKALAIDELGNERVITDGSDPDRLSPDYYYLSDIGDLYVLQRILKPLHDAKMKKDIQQIQEFLNKEEGEIFDQLYNAYEPRDQVEGLRKVADMVLKYAMPTIRTFDSLHKYIPQ